MQSTFKGKQYILTNLMAQIQKMTAHSSQLQQYFFKKYSSSPLLLD